MWIMERFFGSKLVVAGCKEFNYLSWALEMLEGVF